MRVYLKTRYRIEKAVYDTGINVALYNVENSKYYKDFRKEVQDALYSQIKAVAKPKIIENLLMFAKVEGSFLPFEIGSYFKSLGKLINLLAFYLYAGTQGGQAALDKLEIQGTFVLKNQEVVDFFSNHSNLIIDSVDDYTKRWIASKIQQGKDKMLTPREIVQTLIDDGKGISKVRAERIVVTETAYAMSKVELVAAQRYGIEEIIWRTSIDDRVCPICLPLEGVKIRIGESFVTGVGHPPAHPSCRCFMEEVVPSSWEAPQAPWTGE